MIETSLVKLNLILGPSLSIFYYENGTWEVINVDCVKSESYMTKLVIHSTYTPCSWFCCFLQLASVGGFEERLVALEDAYAKAQRQAELALSTSEQIKSKDLQSKVWSLQNEMNDKLAELQQSTISIAALNAIVKNKSVEFEVVKQSVNTMLSANTELAIQISGFSSMLSVTRLRLDEQISVVEGLMSQIEGQKGEISEIKELFASNQESLATNTQELMDIKWVKNLLSVINW